MTLDTAIAYIIFNRPRHTKKSFAAIRSQQPSHLFIIADGPRVGHDLDEKYCKEVRSIVEDIDWPCEVHRNYSDVNLGLKQRVSSGLDWVFSITERAIILEDDCVPHSDFFSYCDELLEYYAEDKRVSVVTGNNFQEGQKRGDAAYYFSKYNHCWGWATWRRAWKHYQGDLPFWDSWQKSSDWKTKLSDPIERRYWANIFTRVSRGEINSWAYPWTASVWYMGGLTATPNVNLVTNIGFGPDGTHTKSTEDLEGLPSESLGELTHPMVVCQDFDADRFAFDGIFGGKNYRWPRRGYILTKRIVRWLIRPFLTWRK